MKTFDDIIPDIQNDMDKIAKKFNETVANEFYKKLKESASDWYEYNSPAKNMYKRTMQLLDKAPYINKVSDYEYHVSFSPDRIWKRPWIQAKNQRMGSYEDIAGSDERETILEWEEKGIASFAQYGYKKGEGIFGSAIFYIMEDIDSLEIPVPKLLIPDEIKKNIIDLMKKNLKKEIQKEYKDFL